MAASRVRRWSCVILMLTTLSVRVYGLEELTGNCGMTIDLMMARSAHSGILNMPMPQSMSRYQDPSRPVNCDVMITFASGNHLLIQLYFLDIVPRSGDTKSCSTGLEIFDQTGRKYYGSRICMEGWEWEERHLQKQQEKLVVQNSPVTFRLVSGGPYKGQGFRLHFNLIRPSWPCYIQEFKCQQIQRCVHDDVTCDGWDDCGDYSDERIEAGCHMLTACEICALVMGVTLLLVAVVEIVMYCLASRRLSSTDSPLKVQTKTPQANNNLYTPEPVAISDPSTVYQHLSPGSKSELQLTKAVPEAKLTESTILGKSARQALKSSAGKTTLSLSNSGKTTLSLSNSAEYPHKSKSRSGHRNHGYTSSQSSLQPEEGEPPSGVNNPALTDEESQSGDHEMSQRRKKSERFVPDISWRTDSEDYSEGWDRYRDKNRDSHRRDRKYDRERADDYSGDDSLSGNERRHRRKKTKDVYYSDLSDSDIGGERRMSRERSNHHKQQDFQGRSKGSGNKSDTSSNARDTLHSRSNRWEDHETDRESVQDKMTKDVSGQNKLISNGTRAGRDRIELKPDSSYEKDRDSPPLPLPPPDLEDFTQPIEPKQQIPILSFNKTNLKPDKQLNEKRARYMQSRWSPQKTSSSEYQKSSLQPSQVGIIYKEESV